jgi:16S rRNA (uracil1498-N3)-methyltransferase
MKDALKDASDMEHKLIPYEMSEDGMNRTRDLFSQFRSGQRIAVFIGPEGGFEEKEIEAARQEGFCVITLGKRILRTETAGMTVLAWLIYQLED